MLTLGTGRIAGTFYKRNDTFHFFQSIPSDLQHRFKYRKIGQYLVTRKATNTVALSDRLKRYWGSFRMGMIYSKEIVSPLAPALKNRVRVDAD